MNHSNIFTEDFTRGFMSILLFLEELELALGLVRMFSWRRSCSFHKYVLILFILFAYAYILNETATVWDISF